MRELHEVPAEVIDLAAARRWALEDERLRILAGAVGDHPLPPERVARLRDLERELEAA